MKSALVSVVCLAITCLALADDEGPRMPPARDQPVVDFLSSGNVMTLPQQTADVPIDIKFSMVIRSIQLFPTKGGWSITGWGSHTWQNNLTIWDPQDFDGIAEAAVSPEDIWHPHDFVLYTHRRPAELIEDTQVVGYASGMNLHIVPTTWHPTCDFNWTANGELATTQTCEIIFGAWVYSAKQMDVHFSEKPFDMEFFSANPCWEVKKMDSERQAKTYPCCAELVYPRLVYKIHLQLKDNAPNFCMRV